MPAERGSVVSLALVVSLAACAAPPGGEPVPAPAAARPAPAPPRDPLLADVADPSRPGHGAAVEAWDELPWSAQCDRLRAALAAGPDAAALFAAAELPPEGLDLAEIRRAADLLVANPAVLLSDGGSREGARSLGAPDVLRLLENATDEEIAAAPEASWGDLHRAAVPHHLPGLLARWDRAWDDAYARVRRLLEQVAQGTDLHRDVVARALLLARAWEEAESRGEPLPRRADVPAPPVEGPAEVESFRRIATRWLEEGRELELGRRQRRALDVGPWMARWARDLRESGWTDPLQDRVIETAEPDAEHPEGEVPVEDVAALRAFVLEADRRNSKYGYQTGVAADRAGGGDGLPRWGTAPPEHPESLDHLRLGDLSPRKALRRLGDVEGVPAVLGPWPGRNADEARLLGRVKDEQVRVFLRQHTGPDTMEVALEAVAILDGLPEPLTPAFRSPPDEPRDWLADPWTGVSFLALEGDPAGAVIRIAEVGEFPDDLLPALGLLRDPRATAILRRARDERWRGAYWLATAGLAIGGDGEARREFLALLADDRTWVQDSLDPFARTLSGDPAAVEHWITRLPTNCCLSFQAGDSLRFVYPTLPWEHTVGTDAGGERRVRAWLARHRFVHSRLLDGLVPERP